MTRKNKVTRRDFFQKRAVPALLLSTISPISQSGLTANETIHIGCIGNGGRFRHLARDLVHLPGVKMIAVCDVWDKHLEMAKDIAEPNAFATKDYQQVLDKKEIDAVMVTTPDHWHVPITVDACQAGKDVYVEKPLTHNLQEGRRVIQAQNQSKRIVQVGMQQRSMPHLQKAREIIRSGGIGQVHKIHLTWNRNSPLYKKYNLEIDPKTVDWKRFLGSAPDQPFDAWRFRNVRWMWDFGGGILTDLMVHYLDVAHWIFDLDHPDTASTIGDHVTTEGIWETPDTIQTLLHYKKNKIQVYFEGTFYNARNRAMMEYMGSDATLYADRGRYEIHPEHDKIKYQELILGKGGRGADFYTTPNGGKLHMENWLECIRTRKKPVAPAEAGVSAASGAHLGNIAYRTGRVARWEEQGANTG